jgi:hypothetical protein
VNDQELRSLVRDAVARHLSRPAPAPAAPSMPAFAPQPGNPHPSHAMYLIVNATDACVIEPSVTCNHCGFCKTHGH